jgi:4-amino-4-deoxy-L-arabinose transferase-like glycosyltransferase
MFRKSSIFGVAAVSCTVLWFALLAGRPLFDPDEGRYAEIPREMLSGGDWVIPHLNALVYLEKPPLQYWLTALAFRGFGQNEFAARLCTGLAGFLSLATVFFICRKLWGIDAGVRALLFTSASTLFVLLGHQLDM